MRISDWSSDVCSSDLPAPEPAPAPAPAPVESASPEPATPEMADDELNLEAENIMQQEAEAVAELTPTPVEEPDQQDRLTPQRREPEAKEPPDERARIAQPAARPETGTAKWRDRVCQDGTD